MDCDVEMLLGERIVNVHRLLDKHTDQFFAVTLAVSGQYGDLNGTLLFS